MSVSNTTLRPAERRDADAIAAIYAPIVRDTVISFEADPPTRAAMAQRIDTTQQRFPWLVATMSGDVVGYAYASEHQQRAAYRWSVNVTAYVAEIARGKGVGRRLYGALLPTLRAQGFRAVFAGIALPNDASVGLHLAVGFAPLGVYRDVGFKFGAWRDVAYWSLRLAESDAAPSEPITFERFRQTRTFSDLLV